jgi:2-isopropylmalate synthase
MNPNLEIYDTTLRDGTQREGLSPTVGDKLRIAGLIDQLGFDFIEGGWPGANPKDDEFFTRARNELNLETSQLVAFGATRRAGVEAHDDPQLKSLLSADTDVICIVGKSWDYHVTEALRVELGEAVAMAADSIRFLRDEGRRVFFDAEHFFDGHRDNKGFTLEVISAASEAGAERVVLCDTNGGTLPSRVAQVLAEVAQVLPLDCIGVHFHNDGGVAVANSLVAVEAGVRQVQGCVNGYGERTGNADLSVLVPNLVLKLGYEVMDGDRLRQLAPVSHHIAEIMNSSIDPHHPYVGASAFAHKAGLHTSALARRKDAYEHVDPESVGNTARMVVSELAGRSTVLGIAAAEGWELDSDSAQRVVDRVKELEHAGYQFEAADGSFELLVRETQGWKQPFFDLESYRVFVEHREDVLAEATVKVLVAGKRVVKTAEGDGPVSALDRALRAALVASYPVVDKIRLTDYRVRDLDSSDGTSARVRVTVEHTDGERSWGTVGVHQNIIDASWKAVTEGLVVGLLRSNGE